MSPLAVESQRNANWPSSISLLVLVVLAASRSLRCKTNFRRLFYVPTHFNMVNLLRRLRKTRKEFRSRQIMQIEFVATKKLAEEASAS